MVPLAMEVRASTMIGLRFDLVIVDTNDPRVRPTLPEGNEFAFAVWAIPQSIYSDIDRKNPGQFEGVKLLYTENVEFEPANKDGDEEISVSFQLGLNPATLDNFPYRFLYSICIEDNERLFNCRTYVDQKSTSVDEFIENRKRPAELNFGDNYMGLFLEE